MNGMQSNQQLVKLGPAKNISTRASRFLATLLILATALIPAMAQTVNQTKAAHGDPVDWVNPYIGSGSGPIGYGGTMPFVTQDKPATRERGHWEPQKLQALAAAPLMRR